MRLGKHIAVIGGGVVGLAIALKLRREGYRRVILFEPGEPGGETSSGNSSLIMTAQVAPLAEPGMWMHVPAMLRDPEGPLVLNWKHVPRLMPWFRRLLANSTRKRHEAIAATMAPMTARSLDAWVGLTGAYEAQKLFRQDGLLTVFRTQKGFRGAKKDAVFRARHGVESEIIPPEELRQMEPSLGPNLAGGILFPESGHCTDPKKLCTALSIAFRTTGGEHQRTAVRKLVPRSGSVTLICDGGEEFTVDEVVVAAGVWSPPLVKPFGVRPMVAADRGYHVMLKHPKIAIRRPLINGDDHFAITPLGDDGAIRLAGTSEFAGIDTPPDWRRADLLLRQAKTILPEIDGEETATRWMGRRPSTPDSLPIIGRTPKAKNIICAFGHGFLGLTLAAVTAEIVADVVAPREAGAGIAALSPTRFS
jgi:glycine/D-amino acid oxidase-like deaminating enzyme